MASLMEATGQYRSMMALTFFISALLLALSLCFPSFFLDFLSTEGAMVDMKEVRSSHNTFLITRDTADRYNPLFTPALISAVPQTARNDIDKRVFCDEFLFSFSQLGVLLGSNWRCFGIL